MTRREVIAAILARARADNRPSLYLKGPLPVEVRKGTIPDDAVYVCVSGDDQWMRLPDKEHPL